MMKKSGFLCILLPFFANPACDNAQYERVHISLADGSGLEVDAACVPDITGERCDHIDNDCDRLVDDDDSDIWQQTSSDPYHCGQCFNACDLTNVDLHGCRDGECTIVTCDPGFSDNNLDPSDGCESTCFPTSIFDYCDGEDNNCDGRTDEDFDLQNDVHNCGDCGFSCVGEYGDPSVASFVCVLGACRIAVCAPNHHDLNNDIADGCEYYCVIDAPVELCDGEDNDCNGQIDDNPDPQYAPPCDQDGVCAGTQPVCTSGGIWQCDYAANAAANGWTYESPETQTSLCDGQDNDCDGQTDEAFNVGQNCAAGSGPCRVTGQYVCRADRTGTECNATPDMTQADVEVCDGEDNDCDNQIDELDPTDPNFAQYGQFVYISTGTFTIFMYEASRPTATSTDEGFGENGIPCSKPGVMPWSNLTAVDEDNSGDPEVRQVCQRLGSGWDLCTDAQWYRACANGTLPSGGQNFPYGDTYQPTRCNGYDYGAPNPAPIATGAASNCYRTIGTNPNGNARTYDMSGNLKEWVRSGTAFEVRGGAYNNVSDGNPGTYAPGLQCDGVSPMPSGTEVHLPSIGFRCCYAGNLFN